MDFSPLIGLFVFIVFFIVGVFCIIYFSVAPDYPYQYDCFELQVCDTVYSFQHCSIDVATDGDFTIYTVSLHRTPFEQKKAPEHIEIYKFMTTEIVAERYVEHEHN